MFKWIGRFAAGTVLAVAVVAGGAFFILWASLPERDVVYAMKGFQAPVSVEFDRHGIPRIQAQTREDAFRALGFVTAQERLFQMDLLRRRSSGRLAEILGPPLLESDRWHRTMGFQQVAEAIAAALPDDQKVLLKAYGDGINQAMAETTVPPFEFLALGYRPELWRMEHSLLVVLGMFETLTWRLGDKERMGTVMEAALGAKLLAFFTPDSDHYADSIAGNSVAQRPPQPVPRRELATLLSERAQPQPGLVGAAGIVAGSNGWLVGPSKTRDGQAMLANDMHLELRVPNIWYRAEMHITGTLLSGVTLPGVPLFVSGTNRHVAWGFTNVAGDFLDFVVLDMDPENPGLYQTPSGPAPFEVRSETIRVRGRADTSIDVRDTIWGPVLPEPLLDKPVAVRWTALDPAATDLDLLDLGEAKDVFEALAIFQQAGGPPLNGLVADSQGNIGWTYVGRIPIREGLDGLVSRSWADGSRGWKGYVAEADKPRLVNPPQGYLVNSNQRMVGQEYPHLIGQDFDSGYRAFRIAERLAERDDFTERDLLEVQLDVQAEFYRYYQALALAVLERQQGHQTEGEWHALERYLRAWDGRAEPSSLGLPVLVEFRQVLADAVLSPFLAQCRALDPNFQYHWRNMDEPLRALLEARAPELQPEKSLYPDWDGFILAKLEEAAQRAVAACGAGPLDKVTWGCINRTRIGHLLSQAVPLLGSWFLDMPTEPIPGCQHCVRLAVSQGGASERLAIAPGHEASAIFHMPAGQSGHPLSKFYRDQQQNWVAGAASPLLAGEMQYGLQFRPLPAPSP